MSKFHGVFPHVLLFSRCTFRMEVRDILGFYIFADISTVVFYGVLEVVLSHLPRYD